ncbi:MAG: hypothetical protein BGO39_17185 [Chloroflexi bacterium 54-19]|nr:MAG: hypothetical protein BGO39_17185 [Chloroflexi bacterium 54-19]
MRPYPSVKTFITTQNDKGDNFIRFWEGSARFYRNRLWPYTWPEVFYFLICHNNYSGVFLR